MKYISVVSLWLMAIAVSAQNISSGLTACYTLNGSALESVNSAHGTAYGVNPAADRNNNAGAALSFTGSSSCFVELPNTIFLKPSQAVSASCWYRPASVTKWSELVFAKNKHYNYFTAYAATIQDHGSGSRFRVYRQNGTPAEDMAESSTPVQADTWYHLAFSIDSSSIKLYVNGVLEDSAASVIKSFNYDSTRTVVLGGTNESNWNNPYEGRMDNLRFYNRVLTAGEILMLYNLDPSCITETTGIAEKGPAKTILLFPNPVHDFLQFDTGEEQALVEINNVMGKCVVPLFKTEGKVKTDLSELPSGLYLIKITKSSGTQTLKLLKE